MDQQDDTKQIETNSVNSQTDSLSSFDANKLKWYQNPINCLRILIVIVLISFLIYAICHPSFTLGVLTSFLTWLYENPKGGTIVLSVVYVLCCILLITGSVLCLGAGFIFSEILGFWFGICYATIVLSICCFIGSCLAFFIGRFLLRNALVYLIRNHPKFILIDSAVKKHGFTVVLLFRLSPMTPYSLFNYIMGFTSVTFRDYCLGAVGIIPNMFLYVYLGASINNIYQISHAVNPGHSKKMLIITIIGVVVLLITLCYFAFVVRNALRRIEKELIRDRENMNNLTSTSENTSLILDDNDDDDDEYNSNDDLL